MQRRTTWLAACSSESSLVAASTALSTWWLSHRWMVRNCWLSPTACIICARVYVWNSRCSDACDAAGWLLITRISFNSTL